MIGQRLLNPELRKLTGANSLDFRLDEGCAFKLVDFGMIFVDYLKCTVDN